MYTGTIGWSWYDDQGKLHKFKIPHSYYVPDAEARLLSPQHWAKTLANGTDGCNHCGETSYSDRCVLFWNDHQLTVPMDKRNNVATFRTAAGYGKFDLYCQKLKVDYNEALSKPIIEKKSKSKSHVVEIKQFQSSKRKLWSQDTGLPMSKAQAVKESKRRKPDDGHKVLSFSGLNKVKEGWKCLNVGQNMSSQSQE